VENHTTPFNRWYMGIAQTLSAGSYHSRTGPYSSTIRSWCNRTNYDGST